MTNNDSLINAALSTIVPDKDSQAATNASAVSAYLLFGKQGSLLKKIIPSTKLRGIEIANRFPESQKLDEALRSNCVWLYEAQNIPGHPANDILQVLGLHCIEDICTKTGNPTVIRRMYNRAKANAQALAA
ncbi:MAG: hypothetical protein FJX25_06640 [Alphaproteobacteria bacterium]|nr:hypothetical protein [Alphaproteobacteria bacterium]